MADGRTGLILGGNSRWGTLTQLDNKVLCVCGAAESLSMRTLALHYAHWRPRASLLRQLPQRAGRRASRGELTSPLLPLRARCYGMDRPNICAAFLSPRSAADNQAHYCSRMLRCASWCCVVRVALPLCTIPAAEVRDANCMHPASACAARLARCRRVRSHTGLREIPFSLGMILI